MRELRVVTGPVVTVVYAPQPELGPDPLDTTAQTSRRLGDVITEHEDMLLVWREWGEQFTDGSRTHVVSTGSWANITHDQIVDTLDTLGSM